MKALKTITTLLDQGGLLDVIGDLPTRQWEVFLDDQPVSVLKLDATLHKGCYEASDLVFQLKRELSGTVRASWNATQIGCLQPKAVQQGTIILAKSEQFSFLRESGHHQETFVFSETLNLRLFRFSSRSPVGLRTILVAPSCLDGDQWQTILALSIFHLIFLESASLP